VPKEIVSNRDPKFTTNFWKAFFEGFGTNLNPSIAYHLQLNGKTGRTNKIIEDMLKIYADKKIFFRDFKVGEHVFLKVKEKRSLKILGCCQKLVERYCGSFEILENMHT
jgi:hypothetical protein